MAYNSNQFSFGQQIPVTGAGVGFPGNVSRMGASRIIRSRPVLANTATSLPFGAGAVELSDSVGGSYQSFADFLATATNAQYLQQRFAGIAVRNVKTQLQYATFGQPSVTTVSTTMTQGTAGSTTIVVVSATGIVVGQLIEGYGIQATAIVTAISGTTITISLPTLYVIAPSTAVTFTNQTSAAVIGGYTAGQEADVLMLGSVTIYISAGTPQSNLGVYVRTVANASLSGTVVGDFEAAADLATAANTIAATTIGSTSVTTSAGTGLAVGQYIVSPLFPTNTYIVSGATTAWVFSQAALATVSAATVAMSAYNTGVLGFASEPWIRFSTGQLDSNGMAEVTILTRRGA